MLIYDHRVVSEDSTILGSTSNKFILELKGCLLKGINQPLRGTSSLRNSYYYRLPFWVIFATFVYYYCPLVLHFSSRKSINKIENLRKSIKVSPKWLFFRLWNSLKKLTNALWKLNEIISIRNFQSFRRKLSHFDYGLFWKKWKCNKFILELKRTCLLKTKH